MKIFKLFVLLGIFVFASIATFADVADTKEEVLFVKVYRGEKLVVKLPDEPQIKYFNIDGGEKAFNASASDDLSSYRVFIRPRPIKTSEEIFQKIVEDLTDKVHNLTVDHVGNNTLDLGYERFVAGKGMVFFKKRILLTGKNLYFFTTDSQNGEGLAKHDYFISSFFLSK